MTLKSRTVLAQRELRTLSWPNKGAHEVLDFGIDWSRRFEDRQEEVITTVVWSVPAGITKDSDWQDASRTVVWLSGGEVGKTYELTCRIRTNWGRTFDQTVSVKVITK